MPIREARSRDIPAIVDVCYHAFFYEEFFGDFMHPKRKRYPSDFKLFWTRRFREHWQDRKNHFLVSTTTDKDGKEIITGVAEWSRQGDGGKAMELAPLDPRGLATPYARWSNRVSSYFYVNRAADPKQKDLMERLAPFTKHHWTNERKENWYLDLLAVNLDYQKKGFGKELVKWGLDRAKAEGIHASVISSKGNEKFYQRCGFGDIVGRATEGEGNPIAHMRGGAILFMEPVKGSSPD